MPQASAKSNTVKPDKPNEPIFTPRFIAGFAVNFILYMQYYALMVAMAGYSAMQFAAGATEGEPRVALRRASSFWARCARACSSAARLTRLVAVACLWRA